MMMMTRASEVGGWGQQQQQPNNATPVWIAPNMDMVSEAPDFSMTPRKTCRMFLSPSPGICHILCSARLLLVLAAVTGLGWARLCSTLLCSTIQIFVEASYFLVVLVARD